jgi:hypothetical protein
VCPTDGSNDDDDNETYITITSVCSDKYLWEVIHPILVFSCITLNTDVIGTGSLQFKDFFTGLNCTDVASK